MKKITHPKYKDYPEYPYISPERDIALWEESPELFPYKTVEKKQMIRVKEGLLPGDIVMLWRIGFDNFTNETVIPQYFEYRYGVDSNESIETLLDLGYIEIGSATETLDIISMPILKKILKKHDLPVAGKKAELLDRVTENILEGDLKAEFTLRKYKITNKGRELLEKYDDIIQTHGPKM